MRNALFGWIAIGILILLVGCFHDQPTPPGPGDNETNATANQTPSGPGGTVITGQRNQTAVGPTGARNDSTLSTAGYTSTPHASVVMYLINVGTVVQQGDAIFIKKGDLDVLVDGGPAESVNTLLSFLESRSVDDIDLLISTHGDPEHYGGLPSVAERYAIENVWWSGETYGNTEYQELINRLQGQGSRIRTVQRGDQFELNGMRFDILNPRVTSRFDDMDNDAIALRLTDRQFCVLLTSDIQAGPQGDIANMDNIQCNIMQAPVHGLGRGHARIDLVLLHVDPEAIVISGGLSEEVWGARQPLFNRLVQKGIPYYENYLNGTIRIVSDGTQYAISYISVG